MKGKTVYTWSSRAPSAVKQMDAEAVNREIEGLSAEEILAKASKKNSILHSAFEWDDNAAATAHRLERARLVARCIIVRVTVRTEPTMEYRANVAVDVGNGHKRYKATAKVMTDADLRRQAYKEVAVQLQSCLRKLKGYDYLCGKGSEVVGLIGKAIAILAQEEDLTD